MKITKFVHSCLLVEMPEPVNRTALFDPGMMSEVALDVDSLQWLDDIIITHNHGDHLSVPFIKKLLAKFPDVRITAPRQAVDQLAAEGIKVTSEPSEGIVFFDSPHESVAPMFPQPENNGVHYLDLLTDPGDSHSFDETKAVLALPVQAPWGSTVRAVNLALELGPQYILPIHDWHWSDAAREQTYNNLEKLFADHDITFCKLQTGQPVVLDV
ncbi:MAG: MBL fold metallo-hydrolase [Candidatus Saccharimonadales bacterium]